MQQSKTTRTNLVVRAAFVFIFIFLFVSVINLQVEMNDLRSLRDEKVEELQVLQDDIDELEYRIKEPVDEKFLERVARALGYRKPNEKIFVNDIAN